MVIALSLIFSDLKDRLDLWTSINFVILPRLSKRTANIPNKVMNQQFWMWKKSQLSFFQRSVPNVIMRKGCTLHTTQMNWYGTPQWSQLEQRKMKFNLIWNTLSRLENLSSLLWAYLFLSSGIKFWGLIRAISAPWWYIAEVGARRPPCMALQPS